mgnify:CR=1 FL=1
MGVESRRFYRPTARGSHANNSIPGILRMVDLLRTRISFGDGLLTGEVIDIVEEGNRLIRFTYEGIFEEILDRLGQMSLPFAFFPGLTNVSHTLFS